MRVPAKTPMRGFGQAPVGVTQDGNMLVPANSVVLTPDQFANINTENYAQGQLDTSSPLSSLPSWALPVALIVGGFILFKSMK